MPTRLRPFLLIFSGLSGLLLLLSALSHAGAGHLLGGEWPRWTTLAAQAGLVVGLFLAVRYQPEPLQGYDFLGLLRRLVLGPGLLAVAGAGLHLLERLTETRVTGLGPRESLLFTTIYTLNLGLFVYYVARVNYAWRSLVLFKGSARLHQLWPVFELLLGIALLFLLLDRGAPAAFIYSLLAGLGGLGAYLGAKQKWVAYLSTEEKWQSMGYQLLILGGLLLFLNYFWQTRHDPQLVAPAAQHTFLLLTALFAAFYSATGLLVAFFNLPTAYVFEQRRAEILSLQRLTQVIQRGKTPTDIYQSLLDSTVQITRADAAWLDVATPPNGSPATPTPTSSFYQLPDHLALTLRTRLAGEGLLNEEFLNNDLAAFSATRDLQLPFRSVVVLPLRSQDYRHATLYLFKTEPSGFEHDDLNVLQAFVSQTLLSLENLQLAALSRRNESVQNELRIAAHVQESLIPKKLPTDDWFEISSHALAAKEVGGDFYDLLLLPGKRLAVLIGDVSGKGVTAAFHMAQMKGIFHSLMQPNPLAKTERTQYPVPSQFMTQANAALTHCLEKSTFITASLFLIDYENGGFMFARAGHCHALYYSSNQEKVEYFRSAGLGLGIIRGGGYEKHINNQFYDYAPGDVMVMYTDGIVEARGQDGIAEYGEDRLLQRLEECYYRSAEDIKDFIMTDVNTFTAGQPMHDDQTLLVIRFKAAQPAARP